MFWERSTPSVSMMRMWKGDAEGADEERGKMLRWSSSLIGIVSANV